MDPRSRGGDYRIAPVSRSTRQPHELSALRSLLTASVLVAGCGGASYDDFIETREALEDDIELACTDALATYDVPALVHADDEPLGPCRWFQPSHGDECLDALDEILTEVDDDVTACATLGLRAPIAACGTERVTRRRRSVACATGPIGPT